MNYNIRDAFKSLEELDDEIVENSSANQVGDSRKLKLSQSQIKLNEDNNPVRRTNRHLLEKSFKLTDDNEVENAKEVLQDIKNNENGDIEVIVDVNANSESDLKDSYIGSIIIECPVCKTKIYKDKEDLVVEGQGNAEEKTLEDAIVNVGEVCPHCKQEGGFVVIGKVAAIDDKSVPSEETENKFETSEVESSNTEEYAEDSDEVNSAENAENSDDETERNISSKFSLTDSGEDVSENMKLNHLEKLTNAQSLMESDVNTIDVDIKTIDKQSFNSLVEKYLREVYDNISTYTTTDTQILDNEDKIIVEGKVIFKSGKTNNTKFIFEADTITKHNLIKFKGINETFSKSKRAFILHTHLEEGKLMSKHLTYDYLAKSLNESKSTKIYGRVSNLERTK